MSDEAEVLRGRLTRGGKCSECDGTGDEMVDSMTLYGIPGGYDVGGPCPACVGTGSGMAERALRERCQEVEALRTALQTLIDATEVLDGWEGCDLAFDAVEVPCGNCRGCMVLRVVEARRAAGVLPEPQPTPTETQLTGENLRDSGMREPGGASDGAQ